MNPTSTLASPTSDHRQQPPHLASGTTAPQASRRTYLLGGLSLVLMAVLAGAGYLVAIDGLVIPGDAAATTAAITESATTFRLGTAALLGVVVLDIVVAWALYRIFVPVHQSLSAVAAVARLVYAAVFGAAVMQLVSAARMVDGAASSADVMHRIDTFDTIWDIGLILFGLHLLVVAYLTYRSRFLPKFLGILVAIAAIGYAFDSTAALTTTGSTPEISTVTFVGELLLAVWLLLRAADPSPAGGQDVPQSPTARMVSDNDIELGGACVIVDEGTLHL